MCRFGCGENEGRQAHDGNHHRTQINGEPELPRCGNDAQHQGKSSHRKITNEVERRKHRPATLGSESANGWGRVTWKVGDFQEMNLAKWLAGPIQPTNHQQTIKRPDCRLR